MKDPDSREKARRDWTNVLARCDMRTGHFWKLWRERFKRANAERIEFNCELMDQLEEQDARIPTDCHQSAPGLGTWPYSQHARGMF